MSRDCETQSSTSRAEQVPVALAVAEVTRVLRVAVERVELALVEPEDAALLEDDVAALLEELLPPQLPKAELQPVPQWSVVAPHQPY